MTLQNTVDQLQALPLRSVDDVRSKAPDDAGFYAWWCDLLALPEGVPEVRHPETSDCLLYVGIAPSSTSSTGSLAKRLRQHTKGAIGSSTFRRGLAALLWESEGWRPIWASTRPGLENIALEKLNAWQGEHLSAQWCEMDKPWRLEAKVIAEMGPPMNLEHNYHHEFHATMSAARADLKRAAERYRDSET